MPQVFVRGTDSRRVFHASEDCFRFAGSQPIRKVELGDLEHPTPCSNCYPDAPRARYKRLACHKCKQRRPYPCRHNGGVPVFLKKRSSPRGLEYTVRMFVWPDMVRFHM